MSTQICEVSTAFGLVTLAAALDAGLLPRADRRILVISTNTATPELAPDLSEVAGIGCLLGRFDAVYDYNEIIAPQHPSAWRPAAADLPRTARHLALEWEIPDLFDVHLVLESIQVPPALTLAMIFSEASIDVYADGLMSYGPTRVALPAWVGTRIGRLLHLDLVPGLEPVLLSEFEVPAVLIEQRSFLQVVDGLGWSPAELAGRPDRSVAVVLGQYLSALGVLTIEEEDQLYAGLVASAASTGCTTVVFKPHPSAPDQHADRLLAVAARSGIELIVAREQSLVESWYGHPAVGLVAGCFSTGLMTAAFYSLPVARSGTELMLERLRPFENSNRIPITIVDAAVGNGAHRGASDLTALVRTVSFCMQPAIYPGLRPVAEDFLAATLPTTERYVSRRRLTALDLPGKLRPRPVSLPRRVYRGVRRRLRNLSVVPSP